MTKKTKTNVRESLTDTYIILYADEFDRTYVWRELCEVMGIDSSAYGVMLYFDKDNGVKVIDKEWEDE